LVEEELKNIEVQIVPQPEEEIKESLEEQSDAPPKMQKKYTFADL
jgi:hypothetical protein